MKCFTVKLLFDSPLISYAQARRQADGRWLVYERIVTTTQEAAIAYFMDLRDREPAPLTIEAQVIEEQDYPHGKERRPVVDGARWCSPMSASPYAAAITRFAP